MMLTRLPAGGATEPPAACYPATVFLRLALLFVLLPLVELALLVKMGTLIGLAPTLTIVVGTGVLGAWLTRKEGVRTATAIRRELEAGQLPADELLDAALIMAAGLVLLTPGVITDLCGFLLLVRPIRTATRRRIMAVIRSRLGLAQPHVIDVDWTASGKD